MNHSALVFDLDDTLIDTRRRHFQVVHDFLTLKEITPFSFDEYLEKRKRGTLSNIDLIRLCYPGKTLDKHFKDFWKENIESSYYLNFDTTIVDFDLLKQVSTANDIYILSLRSNK